MQLFKLGTSIVLSVGDADGRGANVEVAMLMITAVRGLNVDLEFDVD